MERLERLDGLDVGRQRRRRAEERPQSPAPLAQVAHHAVETHEQHGQQGEAPEHVAADFGEAEGQVLLPLEVVDGLRGGVNLEGPDAQQQRVGRMERVDDVLVGIEHLPRAEVEAALLEGGHAVALAELHAPPLAFERVDGQRGDQFEPPARTAELGELDHLHQVLLHLDDVVEAVAYEDAVGLQTDRDGGALLGRGSRERAGEQQERDDSFHRCLKSLMSSTT